MLKLLTPPTYDGFYKLVDHACSTGRPILVVGSRGSGKTTLIGELRPDWETVTTFSDSEVIFFNPAPGESDIGNLNYLHRLVAKIAAPTKSPDEQDAKTAAATNSFKEKGAKEAAIAKGPNELCDRIEETLGNSQVKLLIVDNAQEIGGQFFGMVWKCVENLRRRNRIIGGIFALPYDDPALKRAAAAMPIFGTFEISPLSKDNILDALEEWLPTGGREFSDRVASGAVDADALLQQFLFVTRGAFRAVSDFAYVWKQEFNEATLNQELFDKILLFKKGGPGGGAQLQLPLF